MPRGPPPGPLPSLAGALVACRRTRLPVHQRGLGVNEAPPGGLPASLFTRQTFVEADALEPAQVYPHGRHMLAHHYGPGVHILDDPFLLTLLARLGAPETDTSQVPALVRTAYQRLLQEVLARDFPQTQAQIKTRMAATEPRAFYQGPILCRETKLVLCAVIRAGILPSQTCYEAATAALPAQNVRLDYVNMSRTVDAEHRVTGVRLDGSKIGGPVDDAVVLIPDPMGATGGTVCRAIEIYKSMPGGVPRAIVAMHLMATPESIRRVVAAHPDVKIYTARLDRGLSPPEVLAAAPGLHADRERGLNDVQYVVPGAGGLGELLTNSWI